MTSSTGASHWTYAYEPYGVTRTETKNNTKAPTNLMKFAGDVYANDKPTTLIDPTGLRPENTCGSIGCWLDQTKLGKCYTGIGEGAALSVVSAGTLTSAAVGAAAEGCAAGVLTHLLGEATADEVEDIADGALLGRDVADALIKRSERLERERRAREAARRPRGIIVIVRRVTVIVIR
jgi:hypothetical protein